MNPQAISIAATTAAGARYHSEIDRTVEDRLRSSGYQSLRDVSCIASNGAAYLHGCLSSYYLKQIAQEIAAGIEGVSCVINRIEVTAPSARRRQA